MIHIGIHPKNMRQKLIYHYLYPEEESFTLDVYTKLFNMWLGPPVPGEPSACGLSLCLPLVPVLFSGMERI